MSFAQSIPGCGALVPIGEDRYKATLTVALAAITGTYEGTVALSDKVPPSSYRMTVEGQGRPGFVKGEATIALRPDGNETSSTSAARCIPAGSSPGSASA